MFTPNATVMKKILLLIVLFVFTSANVFANEDIETFNLAVKLKKEANYQEAVKLFIKTLKVQEDDVEVARKICFEIADCFAKDGNEKSAVKFLKVAIRNYGATQEDVQNNQILNKGFIATAWNSIEMDYDNLRRVYTLKIGNEVRKEYAALSR